MDTLFPYTTLFRSLEVYRKGHLVWLLDKSSWLYINAVPTSGNAPPAWPTPSNAYWQNMTPPSIASDRSPTPHEELQQGTLLIAQAGQLYHVGARTRVTRESSGYGKGRSERFTL